MHIELILEIGMCPQIEVNQRYKICSCVVRGIIYEKMQFHNVAKKYLTFSGFYFHKPS